MADKILIVDGNSLLHRAFHALPLLDYNGVYTNAAQGFFSMLFKAFQEQSPQYAIVCFDEHGPTFRHTAYPEYKAGRKATPEELRPQFPLVKELLFGLGIETASLSGYEADDLLGTFSLQAQEKGLDALLLTGDRDALQLVGGSTRLLFTRKGISETILFDPETVLGEYGITPEQVPDWKGLAGDSSDNIPGVPGVGDKTAVKLLQEYQTVENVLAHGDDIKGKLGERIRNNKEQAAFCKELATIRRNAPVTLELKECGLESLASGAAGFQKYGMNAMAKKLAALTAPEAAVEEPADVIQLPLPEYEIVTDRASLAQAAQKLSRPFALCLGDAFTLASEKCCIRLDMQNDLFHQSMEPAEALAVVAPLLADGQAVVHDFKTLLHTLNGYALPLPESALWDTMLGAYVLDPSQKSFTLKGLAPDQPGDAVTVFRLYEKQKAQLEQQHMLPLYQTVELPLAAVLFRMEREGFLVDRGALAALGTAYTEELAQLQKEIFDLLGVEPFNLASTQQLGKVLFETLALPSGKKTKTGYSTSADVLEGLIDQHPAIAKILEYRQIGKLNSTYIDGLIKLCGRDSRVHTTFLQAATVTGRIASQEPNLQNIPVRTERGREIRKAFISKPGCVLLDADYSQIELRILAHLSGDERMVEAFREGKDIHAQTAALVGGVPQQQVTREMRSAAKAVNFGLVYGISEFGLAHNIGITVGEARQFIQKYFRSYPGIKGFMDQAVADGMDKGYAETMLGRRRYLPELTQGKGNIKEFGKRAAMNTPVQGTAADIIKLAMIRVDDLLRSHQLKARLILQVHDELLIECPIAEADEAAGLLKDAMEQVVALSVPLTVEVAQGQTWYETK